ncbi:MAG: hypothetical protein WDM77_12425 [Steroidobacteraceae bacterium]
MSFRLADSAAQLSQVSDAAGPVTRRNAAHLGDLLGIQRLDEVSVVRTR